MSLGQHYMAKMKQKWELCWMAILFFTLFLLFCLGLRSNSIIALEMIGILSGITLLLGALICRLICIYQNGYPKWIFVIKYIVVLLSAFFSWMSLEAGCFYEYDFQFFAIELKYIILNVLTLTIVFNVVCCMTVKWWLSCLISGIFFFIISVVNYYVIRFHSMPLSLNEIRNFGTAMGVIGSYKFRINRYVAFMILSFAVILEFVWLLKKLEQNTHYSWKYIVLRAAFLCLLSFSIFYKGYCSVNPVKAAKNIEYAWQDTFHRYGYAACSIDLIRQAIEVIQEPEDYSLTHIAELKKSIHKGGREDVSKQYPDIILILNESFFDLRQITDIVSDSAFLANWDSTPNAVKGYAVAPLVGAGTNCSEYELLTGNSLQLMPGITPFYVLDLDEANGIASNLNQLGYVTVAAHSEWENSYNRRQSYPNLGFQITRFDTDFVGKEYYGDRQYYETDESLYKNLITWYEDMPSEHPRFLYLLTIQNHGDWNINDSSWDIVHVENDLQGMEELANEYLSCIKQSDEAFKGLMKYFSTVDRPVIVCMVGDHSPWFASQIIDSKYSEAEKNMRLRGTPFLIWSNYQLESKNLGYVSMNYMPSLLLETAGIPLSPYYAYTRQLSQTIPVLSSYGKYYDKDGIEYDYKDETKYSSLIKDYFYLEYNNLNKRNRDKELFVP